MTEDENRKLAEWMGWRKLRYNPTSLQAPMEISLWQNNDNQTVMPCKDWHPRESLEQAMMLVAKLSGAWILCKNIEGKFSFDFDDGNVWRIGPTTETPAAAIVEVVLKSIEEGLADTIHVDAMSDPESRGR